MKAEHHESCTLHSMNVCRMFREKICIIHGVRLLKRLWLKSVMMFSKNAILSTIANDKKEKQKKTKRKEQLWIFFKEKHNWEALVHFIFIFSGPGIEWTFKKYWRLNEWTNECCSRVAILVKTQIRKTEVITKPRLKGKNS